MTEIHPYPEMNAMIKTFLRSSEDNMLLYAAARIEELEQNQIAVRCKDCVHRPSRIPGATDGREGMNLEFPDDWCPMQCEDPWYSQMPRDDFFCGWGSRMLLAELSKEEEI